MKSLIRIKLIFCVSVMFLNSARTLAQTELWGMTPYGGKDNAGVIFKVDESGHLVTRREFVKTASGENPYYGKLVETPNGKLYGLTPYGGSYGLGELFEYDPSTNEYLTKVSFDGDNGSGPTCASLTLNNGKLYGITGPGGNNNNGLVFEFDIASNTLIKLFDFDGTNGEGPSGALASSFFNGKIYGMTYSGGAFGFGVLFEYDPSTNIVTKKLDFNGTNGKYPVGGLLLMPNGKFCGLTYRGGANDFGVLFEYDPGNGAYTKKFDFDLTHGAYMAGDLLLASNGMVYGSTFYGGAGNNGTVFQYDPSTFSITKRADLGSAGGRLGTGGLVQVPNGKIYGLTSNGGAFDGGAIFEYDINTNSIVNRISFKSSSGSTPLGGLTIASNGKVYGFTSSGGLADKGVLFEFDPSTNSNTVKVSFGHASQGSTPTGSLTLGSNCKLYGMTSSGGSFEKGTLFEFDPVSNAHTKKIDFDDTRGTYPYGSLAQSTTGKLYGVTFRGGMNDAGVLFEFDPETDVYTKKFEFGVIGNYPTPTGSLISASNGKLYGMTKYGGISGAGSLFEYDPTTNAYATKFEFDYTNGQTPIGSLVEGPDYKIYGMTPSGGNNNQGVLFAFDPADGTFQKIIDFDQSNGARPYGSLIQANNGKLYGLTRNGGVYDSGTLFEYTPGQASNVIKLSFDYFSTGGTPTGSLLQAPNGKLYGMALGGTNNKGVVFQFDLTTNAYSVLSDFAGINGSTPTSDLVSLVHPQILGNPDNLAVCKNSGTSFTVTDKGVSSLYQWEVSTNGGSSYAPVSNDAVHSTATTSTLNLNATPIAFDSRRYRAVVTADNGTSGCLLTATSNAALLTVKQGVTVNTSPVAETKCEGNNASYAVAATGSGLTYQWQVSTNSGSSYSPVIDDAEHDNINAATLSLTKLPSNFDGRMYRAVVSDGTCSTNSDAASLTVNKSVSVSIPPATQTQCEGTTATYTVAASGSGLTYQWQQDSGTGFSNINGATASTLTLPNVTNAMNGNAYRVQIAGLCTPSAFYPAQGTSVLNVNKSVAVTTSPAAEATACEGTSATYSVVATGAGLTYQWQENKGSGFSDLSGATSPTLSLSALTPIMDGNTYRVQIAGTCSPAAFYPTQGVSVLKVNKAVSVTTVPSAQSIKCEDNTATYTVAATGAGLSYQWQENKGSGFTNISGANSPSLTLTNLTSAMDANLYRVQLSGVCSTPAFYPTEGVGLHQCIVLGVGESDPVVTGISLYPVPTSGLLTIMAPFGQHSAAQIEIQNTMGTVVHTRSHAIENNAVTVDMSELPTGTYLLTLKTGTSRVVKRIIKL